MRLIDADNFGSRMYHEAFEKDSDMQKWDSGCWIRYKLFEKVLREQPTIQLEPHWIPVTERLPETTGEYLVTKRGMYTHRFIVDIAMYFINDGWHKADPVIAWMPLPEAYKEVTK